MSVNSLLAAVLENPADDSPRLAYADWLDEHDEPDRAEFIRVQVGLTRAPWTGCCDRVGNTFTENPPKVVPCDCRWAVLSRRERELLDARGRVWLVAHNLVPANVGFGTVGGALARDGVFTRGFIARLLLPLATWKAAAPHLLASHPLESVAVSDVPGLRFEVMRPASWGLKPVNFRSREGCWTLGAMLELPGWLPDFDVRSFDDRPALFAGASAAVAEITARLEAAAGDRWPAGFRGDDFSDMPEVQAQLRRLRANGIAYERARDGRPRLVRPPAGDNP